MSINKRTTLGTVPLECGIKDAVHTAIVSLRAGVALQPGDDITLDGDGCAIKGNGSNSFGIADPFRRAPIARGTIFWGVLHADQVPSVRHDWVHPQHTFEPPKVEVQRNKYLERCSTQLGVTYDELMAACENLVTDGQQTPYTGTLSFEEFDKACGEMYDLWYEWKDESGHEFANEGTECCPEYDYPDETPFQFIR